MSARRLVVIEAPFGANPDLFTPYLARCINDTLRRGESAMTSVAVYALSGALKDMLMEERRIGINAGLEWYRVADACVCYVDHGTSAGMREGMARAKAEGVPIEIRSIGKGAFAGDSGGDEADAAAHGTDKGR